jgi:hypothetical protein
VEGGPLAPIGLVVSVVVLENDAVDMAADRVPDPGRRPPAGGLLFVKLTYELGELALHAEPQHKTQVVPVHVTSL